MELFHEMGRKVEAAWRSRGYDEPAFADVATRVLEEMQPHRHVTVAEIVEHFTSGRSLEPQTHDRLAHRLFVLHQGRRFHLSVLFWIDQIATPHHHGFWGAFQVLEGSRIHCVYRFEERVRESARFQLGDASLVKTEILHRGDVRPVTAGRGFIHALCHVDRPSVSIVLETQADDAYPTLDYHLPHVACAQHDDDPVLAAQLKVLEVLRLVDPPRYVSSAVSLLSCSPLHASFRILQHANERAGAEAREQLLRAARARHGGLAVLLERTLAEGRRLRDVSIRRGLVRAPEHRFLLALLLYAPDRRTVDELMAARHPGVRPAARIAAWVEELCEELDLPHDETWTLLFRLLVEGRTFREIRARLVEEYDAAEVAGREPELRELCDAITGSPLFRPLFARGGA